MSAAETYPIELKAPDISAYTGNTDIPYVTSFDSGRPGPHVVVNGLTHGNELCGAIALDRLLRNGVRPSAGRLSLSFANVAAYRDFDSDHPSASRFVDEDFNRLWDDNTLFGARRSAELERARVLRPIVTAADLLLDLHSMQQASEPLMLAGLTDKSLALARRVGVPPVVVRDAGHAAGRRMRDYGAFDDPASPRTALLVECGQHWEKRAAAVALQTTLRFLAGSGVLPPADAARILGEPVPPQRVVSVTDAVTIASERFEFTADYRGLEVIAKAGTVIASDGGRDIRTPYDHCVLIMPSKRLLRGQTAVRLGRFTG